ncbi:MAG TPA: UDP binding domain-containing protein, partial [Gemmatimonadales bacterium]|nr:UDP binding domain-containing protein [Gemmatimonadales bacterium]
MPLFWVRKLIEELNMAGRSIKQAKVLVVGVAYKKDIDDLRESPALDILGLLHQYGADVSYHDPYVARFSEAGHDYQSVPLSRDTVAAADAVLIVTDHSRIDWKMIRDSATLVVDTRHILPRQGA